MPYAETAVVFVAGMLGGAVSAVAGGGGLITFPALIEVGIPPIVANATSNAGLFPSNASGAWAYRRELAGCRHLWAPFAIVSALGGLAGGLLLLGTGETAFQAAVPWLLLAATLLVAFGPHAVRRIASSRLGSGTAPDTQRRIVLGALFAASVYGGYFGTGLGIMLLGMLTLAAVGDFQRVNALKNLVSVVMSAMAVTVFVLAGLVHWPAAIAMCVGSAIGGYTGVAIARRLDARHLRWFVIGVGLVLSVRYFLQPFV